MSERATRRYDSSTRQRQAAATRERVIQSALELFGSQGYAGTTLADIAHTAGVSIETVQNYGPKRALLEAAVALATFGPGDAAVLDDGLAAQLAELETPGELAAATARVAADTNSRTYGIWRAWSAATVDDAELTRLWDGTMAGVRERIDASLEVWATRGWLRRDIPRSEIVATGWILASAETYERLTQRAGFTHDAYVTWLAREIEETITGRA